MSGSGWRVSHRRRAQRTRVPAVWASWWQEAGLTDPPSCPGAEVRVGVSWEELARLWASVPASVTVLHAERVSLVTRLYGCSLTLTASVPAREAAGAVAETAVQAAGVDGRSLEAVTGLARDAQARLREGLPGSAVPVSRAGDVLRALLLDAWGSGAVFDDREVGAAVVTFAGVVALDPQVLDVALALG